MAGAADIPDAARAGRLAARSTGRRPAAIRRFTTGLQHYVFEVIFESGEPVVVRIAGPQGRKIMANAARLNRMLRPLGVPLPELLDARLDQEFPHLVLERLIGSDLGDVIATLPDGQLAHIAQQVAKAQGLMAGTATAGRYGYAAIPEEAPHARWSGVLRASLDRSRCRIAAAGLFGTGPADRLEALLVQHRVALDSLPATPFLHDTTTKNVIVTPEGAFSGIVDVDDLCFGDPRFAPALTLASLMVSGGPRRYVDAWLEAAGAADDAVFRLYVALFLVDFMSEHGQDFNGNQRPSVPAERDLITGLFAEVAGGL